MSPLRFTHSRRQIMVIGLMGLSLLFAPLPLGFAIGSETKVIQVGVAVTEIYKQDKSWKYDFERRLQYASLIFEQNFNIRFKVSHYWDWIPKRGTQDTRILIDDLMNRYPLKDNVDIMIGLTQLTDPKLLESLNDIHTIGKARPFSGYLVLRYPQSPLFKIQQETVMVHEIGHLFGAVHSKNKDSIMAPVVKYQIPSKLDPQNIDIINLTRDIDFKRGLESLSITDVQILLNAYTKLTQTDQHFDFYYSLGTFYLKLGQFEPALKSWLKAKGLTPDDPRVFYDLGVLYIKLHQEEQAIKELSTAARLLSLPSEAPYKAKALNYLGAAYFQNEKYDDAYRSWSSALVLTPGDRELKANIAMAHMMQGKFSFAIDQLQAIIKEDPENIKLLTNLGFAHYRNGDYDQALTHLNKALKLAPNQNSQGNPSSVDTIQPSEIHRNLGSVYWARGNKKMAIKHFKSSCQTNPVPSCYKRLGYLYYELGEWKSAVDELSKVFTEYKEDAEIYGIVGVSLARMNDFEKAVGVFTEGLKHVKDSPSAANMHKNLASIYLQFRQWDQAVSQFQLSIAKKWDCPECHLGLGMSYLAQSRLLQARQSFMTVLRIDSSYLKAKEYIANIDQQLAQQL